MEILLGFFGLVGLVSGVLYGFFNAFFSPDASTTFRQWLIFLTFASLGMVALLLDAVPAKLGSPLLLGPACLLWPGFQKENSSQEKTPWSNRKRKTVFLIVGFILFIGGISIAGVEGCENAGPVYSIIGGFLLVVELIEFFEK